MGNDNSSESNDNSGMNDHCYNVGYSAGKGDNLNPDPVGDGINAFPCTLNESTNSSYAQGYVDGMKK